MGTRWGLLGVGCLSFIFYARQTGHLHRRVSINVEKITMSIAGFTKSLAQLSLGLAHIAVAFGYMDLQQLVYAVAFYHVLLAFVR